MPRSQTVRSLLQASRLALAESTAAESSLLNTATKAGRTFSSVAGKQLLTRGATTQLGAKLGQCRCTTCGKVACFGHSVRSMAADAALQDDAPHAPSLTAR